MQSDRPAAVLVAHLRAHPAVRHRPVVVGIDGRSGAGKSTLAAAVAQDLAAADRGADGVVVIEGDEFYFGGSAEAWDRRTAAGNADLVIDWRRQREVLHQLRRGEVARWHGFAWDAPDWDGATAPLAATPTIVRPASAVLLEGAYSCRPELHDLLDLRVLLEVPHDVRRRRVLDREGADHETDWDARWAAAEDHYFGAVMPAERFDLAFGPEGHVG